MGSVRLAAAQECSSACGLEKRACIQSARGDKLACKMECRSTAHGVGLGICMRGCMVTFRSAKHGCDGDHTSCRTGCGTGGPTTSSMCRMMCGHDFVECTQGVLATARECVHGCPDGPERRSCVRACGTAAREGGDGCAQTFRSCTTACGGSPSGAFLDVRP